MDLCCVEGLTLDSFIYFLIIIRGLYLSVDMSTPRLHSLKKAGVQHMNTGQ